MQSEQLILQRLDAITVQLDELARRQRATDDLFEEMTPIAREILGTAIARLDVLDKQGTFEVLGELAEVARSLARPEVLQIVADAAAAFGDAAHARPMGAFRALRATRDDDVQKGIGLVIDVLRRIGHGVNAASNGDGKALDQKAKLAELLGPRRQRMLPAPAPVRHATAPAHHAAAPTPVVAAPEERVLDPGAWTRELGVQLANEQGIVLDAARWALIDAARADFAQTKASPNIQRLTSVAGVTTRDLYQLFPKAPARTIAKIAGLPKPAGCL